jgi:hypothetical protein
MKGVGFRNQKLYLLLLGEKSLLTPAGEKNDVPGEK